MCRVVAGAARHIESVEWHGSFDSPANDLAPIYDSQIGHKRQAGPTEAR